MSASGAGRRRHRGPASPPESSSAGRRPDTRRPASSTGSLDLCAARAGTGVGHGVHRARRGLLRVVLLLPLLLAASVWAREADAQTVQPSVSFTEEDYPAYENAGTAKITVSLASIQSTSTIVRISSANNTATASTDDAAGDYVGFENVDLTIPAGSLTASYTIQILQDNFFENGDGLEGEDFHVTVDSVNGDTSLGGAETEVTIVDDEYTACFSKNTILLEEDAGVFSLKIRLSRAMPFPVTATITAVDYQSTEDVDYEVLKGTHTFKPGTQDGAFEIWIKDDKVDEPNELFRITALVPAVPDGEVYCSTDIIIRDDDYGPRDYTAADTRTVSIVELGARKGQDIIEGANGALGLTHFVGAELSAGAKIANGADYSVRVCATSTTATRSADNAHTAGEDYVVQDGSHGIVSADGCSTLSLSTPLNRLDKNDFSVMQIKAFGDTVAEAPETVTVTLEIVNNPGGLLQLGTSTLTYTIRDNADQRTVSIVELGARKGQDIIEGANGALGLTHFVGAELSAGAKVANGADYSVRVCATSTTATRSVDNAHTAGEDYVVQDGSHGIVSADGCSTLSLSIPLNRLDKNDFSVMQIKAFGDTVHEEPETITVTLEIVDNPGGLLQLGTSTLTYTIRDNPDQRTVSIVELGARKGQDIIEGANGALGLTHFVGAELSAGAKIANGADYSVRVCATSTTATRSADNAHTAGEDYVVQDGSHGIVSADGCSTLSLSTPLNRLDKNDFSVMQIKAFGDTVAEAPETVTVTLEIVNNPGGLLQLGTSTLTYTIRDAQPFSWSCAPHPLGGFTNTDRLVIEENKHKVRVIKYPENGRYTSGCADPPLDVPTWIHMPLPSGVSGQFNFQPSPVKGILISGWNDDKFTGDRCGAVFAMGGHKYQLCVIDDENIPPATTEFRLLEGGRSISINEGQEATHKVIVGKPVAQTALPCFSWGELPVVRDVLFDRGRALDSNGCMKSWPGTPHVGNVIMELYINTSDDNVAQADPRFTIGLKNTRKDGSAEPAHGSQTIEVTVVNDDHTDDVSVHPHPGPMAWVEVKEFFDNLSATAEDRKFSDGTFCNAETPGTRTVTAPGGTGATRTCVKYFARHATHLKWSTGRATPFSYILRAWAPGEGGGRNFATVPGNTGYSAGKAVLDQTAFACNSPEQRAREVTISVREAADWSNELSSPALASGSTNFRVCAHEVPGRDYTYTDGSSLPPGVRSEPPKDVDQYPATEWAHAELPRAEIIVAASNPYVDIRNARKTKFVKEGRRARFFVELSGEAAQDVTVEWRVRPSVEHPRATLGEDVEKASGTLVIAQGETRGEIRVKTYDDSHDDDREKFRVRITSAEGAVIRQQRAHAIIRNDDPMPAAWLARFGRTVAEQALDGIAGRLAAPRTAGMQGTLAGQALSFDAPANDNPGSRGAGFGHAAFEGTGSPALADVAQAFGGQSGHSGPGGLGHDAAGFANGTQSRTMTARDALLGSSFSLTGAADGAGGSLALWGRASHGSFDGAEGTFSLDGEATTALLGADYARDGWLIGLALAQSAGEGAYRDTKTASRPTSQVCPGGTGPLCEEAVREGDGTVDASLTAALPYASLEASQRLKLWGALGYGAGEVTLATAMGGRYRADTTWRMAAAGLRGDLLEAPAEGSGPALALTSDALWARTASEKTLDLAASQSDVTRLRLGLEGSWRMALDGDDAGAAPGASLVPKLEVGARHDGGDAETGLGLELGAGFVWTDPALGLTLDVSGRTLLAHEDDALEDRGFAAALGFDPRPETERGPSFSLRQDFGGSAQGGLDALFQPAPLDERSGSEATSRWTAEAAYGLPAFGGRWTGSPHAGLGLATDARDYTLGWRWTPAQGAHPLSFGLKATRRESDGAAPEHALGFEASARW